MSSPRDPPADASPDAEAWPLPVHDVGAVSAARIRRRAHAVLEREARWLAHPQATKVALWYRSGLEPALWIGLGLGYCAWAIVGALGVLR